MTFQDVSTSDRTYIKYSEENAEGQRIPLFDKGAVLAEGTYLGVLTTDYGDSFEMRNKDGSSTVLNGAGHLASLMKRVVIGDYLRVTYDGQAIIEKGSAKGKKAHRFKIERDADLSTANTGTTSSYGA